MAAVKALCGPTCTWDPVRKLWGTKCTDALQALVRSGKWYPVGIEHEWKGQFLRAAEAHRAEAEAAWMAKQRAEADAKAAAKSVLLAASASITGCDAPAQLSLEKFIIRSRPDTARLASPFGKPQATRRSIDRIFQRAFRTWSNVTNCCAPAKEIVYKAIRKPLAPISEIWHCAPLPIGQECCPIWSKEIRSPCGSVSRAP